eukprot:TRINITY_DN112512_c0_g1_i1.p1 TRINITY_DN112512_c0_g1~~TRINITY_DN112512_c0_g1_i1.p1  ORF type:complete len:435 (-),score=76.20 TRINITY_DN112512_c0_g1_i1:265-1569(-)
MFARSATRCFTQGTNASCSASSSLSCTSSIVRQRASQLLLRPAQQQVCGGSVVGRSAWRNSSRSFCAAAEAPAQESPNPLVLLLATTACSGVALFAGDFALNTIVAANVSEADVKKPFKEGEPRWNQESYMGRVATMRDMVDFRLLFLSMDDVKEAQNLLQDFRDGKVKNDGGEMTAKLWRAKQVVGAVIHPVTGEEMFLPGRLSAFVPVNMPVAAGMLIHGPTSAIAAAFWQWMNQTANAFCNVVNRSGAEIDMKSTAASYSMAVGTSMSIAIASGKAMKAYPTLQKFGPFVPYFAVICASTANMLFSRMDELQNGVAVNDEHGNFVGKSQKAGFQAVTQTLTTRGWISPIPILLLPPMCMTIVKTMIAAPLVVIPLEVSLITGFMYLGVPMAVAICPQTMVMDVKTLEPEFQNLKDPKTGNTITTLYANKGL